MSYGGRVEDYVKRIQGEMELLNNQKEKETRAIKEKDIIKEWAKQMEKIDFQTYEMYSIEDLKQERYHKTLELQEEKEKKERLFYKQNKEKEDLERKEIINDIKKLENEIIKVKEEKITQRRESINNIKKLENEKNLKAKNESIKRILK
jgi:hypothetical protein